jgi:hypothetical protein
VEWLLVLAGLGGGGMLAARWRSRRALGAAERMELEGVRRLAEEDVTVFGEQLSRLDTEVGGHQLDQATRVDYQTALDAYESATRAAPRIASVDQISAVVDTLTTGRFALACVQARVAGQPLPQRRTPCFFNPQHGPAVADVMWTRPGHGTRRVPACAQDVARVGADEQPEIRRVALHGRSVPYWEAGRAYLPYTEGYFAGAAALAWVFNPVTDISGPHSIGDGSWGGAHDGGGFDAGGDGGGGGGDG